VPTVAPHHQIQAAIQPKYQKNQVGDLTPWFSPE
jgi:hypothetical protein